MIKCSETRDDGSIVALPLFTLDCSNMGNPYFGITPAMLSRDFPMHIATMPSSWDFPSYYLFHYFLSLEPYFIFKLLIFY